MGLNIDWKVKERLKNKRNEGVTFLSGSSLLLQNLFRELGD